MSVTFLDEPEYEDLPDGRTRVLMNDVRVRIGMYCWMTIPKGFESDMASVPRFLWAVIPPIGPYNKAALLHDYLYKTGKYTRDKTDKLFLAVSYTHLTLPTNREV